MEENIIYIKNKKYIVCGRYIDESGMYLITCDEDNKDTYIYFNVIKDKDKVNYEEVDAKIRQEFNEKFHINANNIYNFRNVYDEVDVFKNKINSKEEQVLLKKSLATLAYKLPNLNINDEIFKDRISKLNVCLKTPLEDKELIYANGYLESNGSKITILDKYSEDFKLHTLTHELMHLASISNEKRTIKNMFQKKKHGLCVGTFGVALDEGVTDLLASIATSYETQDVYAHEKNMAKAIYLICKDNLLNAYINANQESFINEFSKYTGSKEKTISMIASMDLALKWQINSQRKNKTLCMTTFVADSENIIIDAYQNKIKEDLKLGRDKNEIKSEVNYFSKLFMNEKYENVYLDYLATRSYGINKVHTRLDDFKKNINESLIDKTNELNHVNIIKNIDDDYTR